MQYVWRLLLAVILIAGATAQTTVRNVGYNICQITSTTPTTCTTGRGYLVSVENVSQSAQTATITCTDNGATIKQIGALGITQVINYADPGTPFYTNLVCTASGALTGTGVFLYYRTI